MEYDAGTEGDGYGESNDDNLCRYKGRIVTQSSHLPYCYHFQTISSSVLDHHLESNDLTYHTVQITHDLKLITPNRNTSKNVRPLHSSA